ncbi:MAG: alpha/beta hydrolase fold domain-containing protein [Pirellulaceae bacterium]|nr:alpha/beta hydrolase fold domain-containing protein [Pirellulaceae bacterium]
MTNLNIKHFFYFTILLNLVSVSAMCVSAADSEVVKKRFQKLDTNRDGKLTGDEIVSDEVRKYDGDGDGTITLDEANKVYAQLSTAGQSPKSDSDGKSEKTAESTPRTTRLAAGSIVTKDVRYIEMPGVEANDQNLDIYAPANAKHAPVLVYVHGGGWAKGDKKSVGGTAAFFNEHGYIYVSINYRLLPSGKHPININDVASAMAWVHSNIAEHGGDPGQLFLYGHSAGAHLVALLATDETRLKAAGKDLGILRGVIPLDTNAYDVPKIVQGSDSSNIYAQVFGSDPAMLKDAAPSAHVAPNKGIPPMLVFHSNTGFEMRNENGKAFVDKLREAGVKVDFIPSPKQSHGAINQQFGTENDMVTEAAMKFFNGLRVNIR